MEQPLDVPLSLSLSIYIYIYIYIHTLSFSWYTFLADWTDPQMEHSQPECLSPCLQTVLPFKDTHHFT